MARILIAVLVIGFGFHSIQPVAARDLDKLYEKANFKIGARKLVAYVADDDERRQQGLMYVEKLPENVGMIFIFENERPLGFWMKNTLIPLQIAFLDRSGKIIDIQEMKVADSVLLSEIPTYRSNGSAQLALEMNTGWFTRNKIKAGDRLDLEAKVKSPLLNTLFTRKTTPKSPKQSRQ